MSTGVEFEEDSFNSNSSLSRSGSGPNQNSSQAGFSGGNTSPEVGGIGGWLVRHHLAKTPLAAQKIMIGIAIVNFTIAILAIYSYL